MSRSVRLTLLGLAVAAGLSVLPYAGRTLSPDEGGLLLVAGQWSPGDSLYGDYFVDRPPGLIALAALADATGGGAALRVLGALAVVAGVLLAGAVGRLAAPTRPAAPLLTAATAALLTITPLFGGTVVNGELLGLPFLVGGFAAALRAATAATARATWAWAVLAGAAGAGAVLVKQSLLDGLVFAVVLTLITRRPRLLAGLGVGALLTIAVAVGAAASRGTDPGALWDAVVVFRREAAAVIADSATEPTRRRFLELGLALLASGAPLLAVALARGLPRPALPGVPDLRWPALATLAWELAVVVLGGSYWLHYLIGLVPGLVLLTAAACQRPLPLSGLVRTAYAVVALSTAVALTWTLVKPTPRSEQAVIDWLERHAQPGETATVAFGTPNVLQATGLHSPYPDLWSLPARVHDPDLSRLTALLGSAERPDWLIVTGRSLDTWGVDAAAADAADRVRDAHYARVTAVGSWTIYRVEDHR